MCKQLLEVVVDLPWILGQDGEGRVVAHAPKRLFASHSHRQEQHVQLLAAISEHVQPTVGLVEIERRAGKALRLGPLLQVDHAVRDPVSVGVERSDVLLDFVVRYDALCLEVHQEHFARLQAVLNFDLGIGHFGADANFGRQHDVVVLGNVVARRP